MMRTILLALFLLFVWGCEGYGRSAHAPGPNAAHAEEPDSVPTVTRRIWSGPQADFLVGLAPNGQQVAFTNWETGDVMIRNLLSGENRTLTNNPKPYEPGFGMYPRIAPDGERIVYNWWTSSRASHYQLRVVVEGSEPRVIYDEPTPYIQAEDWSPDGQHVLAWRTQDDGTTQIVLVPAAGGAPHVLKTLDWRPPVRMNFSPDGRFVLYDFAPDDGSTNRDIYALDLKTGRDTRLIEHPADDYVLGWAPDGLHVLFASNRSGTPGAWLTRVLDGRAAGEPILAKPDFWRAAPVGFTTDGSFFYGVEVGTRGIYVADLDPRTGRVVGPPTSIPLGSLGRISELQWSPDGRSLTYVVDRSTHPHGPRVVVIRSLDSGETRELPIPIDLLYPGVRWSPDGTALLIRGQQKGRTGLFEMDVQTGQVRALFKLDPQESLPGYEITPDKRTIVYHRRQQRPAGSSIIARSLQSQDERVLYQVAGRIHNNIALSPDGATAAFIEARGEDLHHLKLISLGGGEPRRAASLPIRSPGTAIAWSADGRSLFAVARLSDNPNINQIWRVSAAGGDPEPIGVAMERLGQIRADPQGRGIAFVAGQSGSELWVMENFLPGRVATARER